MEALTYSVHVHDFDLVSVFDQAAISQILLV
jgi:hypothetical protein